MNKLKELISTYKDFPRKGIDFKDLFEITQEPEVFKEVILKMSTINSLKNSEAIIAIDARGFIFGSALSLLASKPLVAARKRGKLPGEIVQKDYGLEYGVDSLSIQKKVIERYKSFVIVDDLLATGGTANCVADILESSDRVVTGLIVVAEINDLLGRSNCKYPVSSIVQL